MASKAKYTIWSYPENVNVWKALIAGQYAGVEIDYPQNFQFGVDNRTPEFLKKNPNGEVPTLDTPDGPIYESNAIAKYVVRIGNDKGLYGSNEYEASLVDQWIEWYRSKLEWHVADWVWPIFGYGEQTPEKREKAIKGIKSALDIFEGYLKDRTWIVGSRVTLADIIIAMNLKHAFCTVFEPEFLKPYPNVTAWFKRCIAEKQFQTVMGEVKFCEKELAPGALAFKE